MSFRILGTGSALPERVVTNDDLSDFLDTSDEWIFTRTGIKERRICTEETLDDLAMEASRRALDMAGVAAGDLDLIVCSTTTGDHLVPAEACVVAEGLGANCAAFDVSGACAGFVLALDVADGFMARGRASRVLVVAAEQMSRVLDWEDRATCVLFGDGAGAAVISVDGGQNPLAMSFSTTPDVASLNVPGISGTCPFTPAGHAGVAVSDIDHFVFHQANERILSAAVKLLGVDDARVVRTLRNTGNVSSACIPLALDSLVRSGELKRGELVALVGFGAGLDTGACLLRWEQ